MPTVNELFFCQPPRIVKVYERRDKIQNSSVTDR